ncbi:MAG: ABC transporter ATP-binding protein/permease [Rhizobiales bacterium]|nr:ABC transporter ATP-binding protein/permease [Hyphomicrobiales bacterium]MBI3674276.1 ABC transporter ATP-binding protein/permease [Hyphomicrobiales bacterium]
MTRNTPPSPAGAGDGNHWAILRDLLPYLWPDGRGDLKGRVVIAMVALILSKIVTVWTPYAFKYATDALTAGSGTAAVAAIAVSVPLVMVVAYGFGRIMMVALAQFRDAIFAKVGQRAVRELSIRTFRHLHILSLKFHLERRTGGLSRIVARGTAGIDTVLRFSLFNTFPTLLEIALVAGVLAWSFGWAYAAVVLATVVIYVWYTYAATEWRIGIRRAMNEADNDASTKAIDSLLNFETVKYFGNEDHEARRYDKSMARYETAAVKTWVSLAVLNAGQAVIYAIGLTIVMAMSAYAIAGGRATVGDLVMINALMVQLYMPLNFIGSSYREIKQGLIDVEQMFNLLKVNVEVADAPDARALIVDQAEVVFEAVSFAYDSERPIIRNLSFRVPPGHTVAIVGPSGAGKSTISRLLYRFYDVSRGRILIDGQDIAKATQKSLRAAIGMVPQDTVLFNDTIRYNIRYGRPEASNTEVEDAAKLAQIHSFVMSLPKGYDALVGERGLKLSGGEKQRVSIARTILKGPPILILDEATSALDSHTEQDIQDALRKVSSNRTTLVIAHRLSTVVDADEIIVLDKGQVAERGTHAALLRKNGLYASMWNRQREADEARNILAQAEAEDSEELLEAAIGKELETTRRVTSYTP